MNQAIIFIDRETWQEQPAGIEFPALVNRFQITCFVAAKSIRQRFNCSGDSEQLLTFFREHRWLLEEEAEKLIKDEAYHEDGKIVL